jgi:hypothetical protein
MEVNGLERKLLTDLTDNNNVDNVRPCHPADRYNSSEVHSAANGVPDHVVLVHSGAHAVAVTESGGERVLGRVINLAA